ncbi:MAG: sensor histidine kinase [Sphingobacterium sp.]|jgi:signal transduction histidine kinase|nr:sensor histidine kinase [Sphingobacterium sp.]
MKKLVFLTMLLYSMLLSTFALQRSGASISSIDSLRNVFNTVKNDSVRARAALLLTNKLMFERKDTAAATGYLGAAQKLCTTKPYLKALYTYYSASHIFMTAGETDECLQLYKQAAEMLGKFETKEAYEFWVKAWWNYAMIIDHKDDRKGMVRIQIDKIIPAAIKQKDYNQAAKSYQSIGSALKEIGDAEKGIYYFKKGLELYEKYPLSKERHAISLLNLAREYVESRELNLAKSYLLKSEQILDTLKESVAHLNYGETASMYYCAKNDFTKALEVVEKALKIAERLNMPYEIGMMHYQKFNIYYSLEKYELALRELKIVIRDMPYDMTSNMQQFTKDLSDTYAKLKDYPNAYDWLAKHVAIKDSLAKEIYKSEIAGLEAKFRATEKNKKIMELEFETKQAALQQKNQQLYNYILGMLSLVLLFLLGLAIYLYRQHKRKARGDLELLKQQQELQVTRALLEGEELERHRVARDLHDGLGGHLTAMRLQISSEENLPLLDGLKVQLDQLIADVRLIAHNMMPENLSRSGLIVALEDLCTSLQHGAVIIELQSNGLSKDLAGNIQVNIYRIIQELINNAIRHGEANRIIVQCLQNEQFFLISVDDNGKGFDVEEVMNGKRGMGLKNVQMRVEYLNGQMNILSQPGQGTSVNIEINV